MKRSVMEEPMEMSVIKFQFPSMTGIYVVVLLTIRPFYEFCLYFPLPRSESRFFMIDP